VLRATEQERVRLAADLHDGPVQELTALRYGLTRARTRIQRGQPEQAERLLAELEAVLYRVTQETLNNVAKHAGASRVTVCLAAENGSVRVRINDDGVGFDPGGGPAPPRRRPLRPGRHARAGRDGRRPPHHRLRPGSGTTVDVEMANRPIEPAIG